MTDKEAIKYLEYMKKNIGFNRIGYVYGNEAIETVLNLIQTQDKIIDLMAKYIAKIDIEEDICRNNLANTELCNEECSNCVECIKKHFINKAEKENKDE